jgi:hypothetical protein
MFMWFDPMYMLFVALPCMVLAGIAQAKVKSAFARGSRIMSRRGWSGAQVAQAILDANDIRDVSIEPVQGYLSDHYDPRHKVLRLSPDVYHGRSLASAGVAAHEVGHAIQHARGYAPLAIRNAVVPVAGIGSSLGMIMVMIGAGFGLSGFGATIAVIGAALFTFVVVFQVVNLPVEFNASRRARATLLDHGLVTEAEDREVGRVLNAAAMTYVAATITAILTLLYLLMRSGLLGGRDD